MSGPWDADQPATAATDVAKPWANDIPVLGVAPVTPQPTPPNDRAAALADLANASVRQKIEAMPANIAGNVGALANGASGMTDAAANAATFGLADPVSAAGRAAVQPFLGPNDSTFGDRYQRNLAQQRAAHEAFATENPGLNVLANMGGSVAGIAPALGAGGAVAQTAAPSLTRMMAQGAGVGGGVGAAQGLSGSQTTEPLGMLKDTGTGAAIGAGIGAALPVGLGSLARLVSPNVNPNVQTLRDIGVNPTFGQIMGGGVGRLEEAAGSIPILGDFMRSGRFQANEQFNRGVINRALAPIGESLGDATALGRPAIDEMQTKITGDLDKFKAIPQVATKDPTLDAQLQGLMNGTALPTSLPQTRVDQLKDIIQTKVLDRFNPQGGISGEDFQNAVSDLGKEARQLMHFGSDSDQRGLGLAVQDAQTALRSVLDRTAAPEHAAALANNNAAYANMLRVQDAASRQGAEEGVFTPAQLSASVRKFDPSKWKNQFAGGNALMQDLSDAGKSVLGSKVPDSGTPFRSLAALLGGAIMGHGSVEPTTAALGLGGGLGAIGAYSNPGRALLANVLTSRPQIAAPVGAAIRQLAPLGGVAAGNASPALIGSR
jgi:hypothetical protein